MIRIIGFSLLVLAPNCFASSLENNHESAKKSYRLAQESSSSSVNKPVAQKFLSEAGPVLLKPSEFQFIQPRPIASVKPVYPRSLEEQGTVGSVLIWFDIDTKGIPRNLSVVNAESNIAFVDAAMVAARQWRFEPFQDGAEKNNLVRQSYTIDFKAGGGLSLKEARNFLSMKKEARAGDANIQFQIAKLQSFRPKLIKKSTPTEWFFKAAQNGHVEAQLMLARSLLKGQGCEKDVEKGMKWLKLSADGGNRFARKLVAVEQANSSSLENKQQAFEFLDEADDLNSYEKIILARMLADSSNLLNNPERAIQIVDELDEDFYFDPITPYQIKGDAYFTLGNFEESLDAYEDALDEAEDLEADLSYIQKRIVEVKEKLPEDESFF